MLQWLGITRAWERARERLTTRKTRCPKCQRILGIDPMMLSLYALLLTLVCSNAFLQPSPTIIRQIDFKNRRRICSPSAKSLSADLGRPSSALSVVFDANISVEDLRVTTSLVLGETEAWVAPVSFGGDIFLNILSFLMLCRGAMLASISEEKKLRPPIRCILRFGVSSDFILTITTPNITLPRPPPQW